MAGIVEGAAAMQQQAAVVHSREASFSESPEVGLAHDDDSELEVRFYGGCMLLGEAVAATVALGRVRAVSRMACAPGVRSWL